MRPLFTKHVAHPVRSRFSAFAWSKPSLRGTVRLTDDEEARNCSPNTPNLSGKTLTTFPQSPGKSANDSFSSPEYQNKGAESGQSDMYRADAISPSLITFDETNAIDDPTKKKRRKEHWEIVEEEEQAKEKEQLRKARMDPTKWEQRKQEWERIERMSSKRNGGREAQVGSSMRTPPPNDGSWYHGWGNRLGSGDGNQGWELELGPMAGGVELPPSSKKSTTKVSPEDFGRF